jgi:8-hydroxy-5-deazaflavin:NADPH oxidoreductase
MRIAVLGTGTVGRTIATKLVDLGHEVTMGSRSSESEALRDWLSDAGEAAGGGSFADAAAAAELVFNCTAGGVSLDALAAARADNLAGKTVVDVANPLDFSRGMPPTLTVCNDDSLGERIQAAFPQARVVKALNTINAGLMVAPEKIGGDHALFIGGNDDAAKSETIALLESFGWPGGRVIDLGDISAARGTEMYLPLWLRLMGSLGTAEFNIEVRKA